MKSISELSDFYYNELYPELELLEKQRKQILKRLFGFGALYFSITIVLAWFLYEKFSLPATLFFSILSLVGASWLYNYLTKEYSLSFKNKIITALIREIDENLEYDPQKHIEKDLFRSSQLFANLAEKISGNDYVKGSIDGIPIRFSDIHAQTKRQDEKGNDLWETLFLGLFIVSEFPKNFHGQTVVLPDNAQKIFGELIGGWLQKSGSSTSELVKMDNIEFEKEFVVYSTDQIEARYILTPAMMQKLLNYKKKSKHPIYVSFIGGKIYLAIEYNRDMFEASVFHSLLEYKIAQEYIETLHLAVGIVEELKLNQKLWSKL